MDDLEAIYEALYQRGAACTWGTPERRFEEHSRRVKLFNETAAQPALFQAEHGESEVYVPNLGYKTVLQVTWIIYHRVGADPAAIPATENNLILAAIRAALADDPGHDKCTLNGMVHKVWIEGDIFKDPGDLDKQALMTVPVRVMVGR